jgi:hypothetical protein
MVGTGWGVGRAVEFEQRHVRMASVAARPTLEVIGAWSQTDSDSMGPPGGEHPAVRRGGPVYEPEPSAARAADAPARTTRRTRSSGPPEDRARSRGSGRGSGVLTGRMTADFARLRDISCVEQTYGMCRYDRTGARLILFRSINLIQRCLLDAKHSNKGIRGPATEVAELTLNQNPRMSLIHSSQDSPYSR